MGAGGGNLPWISFRRTKPAWAGVPDPDVLAMAAEQDRILVSHDYRFGTLPISSRLVVPVRG
jgi:predicted nuclease of predicted toxin-antitoxin system